MPANSAFQIGARIALSLASLLALSLPVDAATTRWIGDDGQGGDGSFLISNNWDAGVPGVGDTALFDALAQPMVFFTADVASDLLDVDAGDVTFQSSLGAIRNYDLITGDADASIAGGDFTLNSINLNIGDDLAVLDSIMTVQFQSDLTVGDRTSIATSGGDAEINFDNASFDFGGLVRLALSGFDGTITLNNNSFGNIGGDFDFVRSGTLGSGGFVEVNSGSTLTTNGRVLAGDILSSGAVNYNAFITVDDGTFTMNGANSLRVGDSMFDNVNAELRVRNNGAFHSGIGGGNIIVQRTGLLALESGGAFHARNDLLITQGAEVTATADALLDTQQLFAIQSGSIVTLDGGADLTAEDIELGIDDSAASLTLSGTGTTAAQSGTSTLHVGSAGTQVATLTVADGAIFAAAATTIDDTGTLNVNGGPNPGDARGVFTAHGPMTVRGLVNLPQAPASPGDAGGVLRVNSVLTVNGGTVALHDGMIDVEDVNLLNFGQLLFTGGILHFDQFSGDLRNQGGVFSPGRPSVNGGVGQTDIIGGGYDQQSGELAIEIGGPVSGVDSDFILVQDDAVLGGDLQVELTNGYVPASDAFFVIVNAQRVLQNFDNVLSGGRIDTAGGEGSFLMNISQGAVRGQIALTEFLSLFSADFDNDLDVDGRDFLLGQRGFGTISGADRGDGDADGDGDVDAVDLNAFEGQYGQQFIPFRDWDEPAGGSYETAANWNPQDVPDGSAERARFPVNANYTVTFASSPTVHSIVVSGGGVTFADAPGGGDTNLASASDVLISGGDLSLSDVSGTGDVNLNVGGSLQVSDGSTFTVSGGAELTAGPGGAEITNGGVLQVQNATFNANGNVSLENGDFALDSFASFHLAAGQELTAENGADVDFDQQYIVRDGTTWTFNSASDFTVTRVDVHDGTLEFDGLGSSLVTDLSEGPMRWGANGHTAVVTFRNDSGGDMDAIDVARDATPGTTATLNVESGATITTRGLSVATNGGDSTTGTVNITGSGSAIALSSGNLVVGHSSTGTANVSIGAGGRLNVSAGTTTVNATGTVNFLGGTFFSTGDIDVNGGTFGPLGETGTAFDWANNQTMTVRGDGEVLAGFGYDTPDGATFHVTGNNSRVTGFGPSLDLLGASQILVDLGGAWTKSVNVLQGSSITVDGQGSELGSFDIDEGTVTVTNEAIANSFGTTIGDSGGSPSASATVNVLGVGTQLNMTSATIGSASGVPGQLNVIAGNVDITGTTTVNATGAVLIDDGGRLDSNDDFTVNGGTLDFRDGTLEIAGGVFDPGVASLYQLAAFAASDEVNLTLTGGASLAGTPSLRVGGTGTANFTVSGGAQVTGNSTIISEAQNAVGTVTVTGGSSTWTVLANLTVALEGEGALIIAQGGAVNSQTNGFVAFDPGSSGMVTVTGADSRWDVASSLRIGGGAAAAGGVGSLVIDSGGAVDVGQQLTIWNAGTVSLTGGSLAAATIDNDHGGSFAMTGGRLTVDLFQDGSFSQDGGTLAPGDVLAGTTAFTGILGLEAGATLEIDVGGVTAGSQHDLVTTDSLFFTNNAALDVELINGFVPDAADTFTVLTSATNFLGSFGNVASGARLTTSDGAGSFLVTYGGGSLSVVLSDFQPPSPAQLVPEPTTLTVAFLGLLGLLLPRATFEFSA